MNYGRRTRKDLKKIDEQLDALRMSPVSGSVEERIARASLREAETEGLLLLLQGSLAAFGVIAAAYAINDAFGLLAVYIICATLVYVSLIPRVQARRGRRTAVRAVLEHRITRAAAVHAARTGDATQQVNGDGLQLMAPAVEVAR